MLLSIIIPSRGGPLGLWATIHSCISELEGLPGSEPYNYEFVVVTNGEMCDNVRSTLGHLDRYGRLTHVHSDSPLSAHVARRMGVEAAKGDVLCFFDNHCLVGRGYFDRAVYDTQERGLGIVHSATVYHSGQGKNYHYNLQLGYRFWGEANLMAGDSCRPYRIAAGGHGGFVVRREVWDRVGGYGPDHLLKGYAGEELIFDLKAWRMGEEVWLDPKMVHYHFAGERGYSRHHTDEYYINLLTCALVIGGEKWLEKVYDSFCNGQHMRAASESKLTWYEMYEEAWIRGADYSRHLDAVCGRSLDELLRYFECEGVHA